ncbi:MAG: tRNA pseudouridine(38-40) synthase TruA [Planctomycetes bacterium]|nr:tRNA pseudouridine(38-40) synthase TruA [Planctomycetota bacterium]
MRRIAVKLEYDGTNFCGWQLQADVRTVQGVLEEAARNATGVEERVLVEGAGRTDAGVHAAGQVAHFDTESDLDTAVMGRALDNWLPRDVGVLACAQTDKSFHARFSASGKHYCYRIIRSQRTRPLWERYYLRVWEKLKVEPMRECAGYVVGTHDFASFTSAGSEVENTVRTMHSCKWQKDGENLLFDIVGEGFTYNMVRALVGTMLEVGREKWTFEEFKEVLEAGDRRQAGPTAPSNGLILREVLYPEDVEPFTEHPS